MEKVREDLNKIVKGMSLVMDDSRYSTKSVCKVTLHGVDKPINFVDKNNALYDVLKAAKDLGMEGLIKSKKLVEEVKGKSVDLLEDDLVDKEKGTFIAVLYELTNGRKYYMFPSRYSDLDIVEFVYSSMKSKEKNVTKGA